MAVSYMDYTSPDLQFFADVSKNRAYTTNDRNYINVLGYQQLNTLGNASLLDIFFTKGHYVEPHYHPNATELVYAITGKVNVSMINPFTNKLITGTITPGQVANIPQGWWHYEEAAEDNSHVIAIFDAPQPEVILGSDILRLTPSRVMAETYCLDEAKWKEAISPITKTVGIGPLDDCTKVSAASKRGTEAPDAAYAAQPKAAQAAPYRVPASPYPGQQGGGYYGQAVYPPYAYPAQGYYFPAYDTAAAYGRQPFAQPSYPPQPSSQRPYQSQPPRYPPPSQQPHSSARPHPQPRPSAAKPPEGGNA